MVSGISFDSFNFSATSVARNNLENNNSKNLDAFEYLEKRVKPEETRNIYTSRTPSNLIEMLTQEIDIYLGIPYHLSLSDGLLVFWFKNQENTQL